MNFELLSLTSVLSASPPPPLVCPRAPTFTPTGTNSTADKKTVVGIKWLQRSYKGINPLFHE